MTAEHAGALLAVVGVGQRFAAVTSPYFWAWVRGVLDGSE